MVSLFSRELQASVEAAVKRAELRTSGELRVALVQRTVFSPLAVGLITLVGSAVVSVLLETRPVWGPTLVDHLVTAALCLLVALAAWKLDKYVATARRVRAAAARLFTELGIAQTQGRTGVLLYIAFDERRVELIADRGIDEKLPKGTWEAVLNPLVGRLKAGELEVGVATAIDELGRLLGEHFPRAAGDVNELPDSPIVR